MFPQGESGSEEGREHNEPTWKACYSFDRQAVKLREQFIHLTLIQRPGFKIRKQHLFIASLLCF